VSRVLHYLGSSGKKFLALLQKLLLPCVFSSSVPLVLLGFGWDVTSSTGQSGKAAARQEWRWLGGRYFGFSQFWWNFICSGSIYTISKTLQ